MRSQPGPEDLSSSDAARQLERYYEHLTLAASALPGASFLEELGSCLKLTPEVRAHLLTQDPARLLIYRDLTRATYRRAISGGMPRATARLGEHFEALFSDFLATRATQSRFLRDITWDFLDYVKTLPNQGHVPGYLLELGEFEAIRIVVAAAPDPAPGPTFEPELKRGLVFSEAARLLHFDHAVHQLPDDEADRTVPLARPTHLLAYRSPKNRVRYLELSPLAAWVVGELMVGAPLGAAVKSACQATGEPLSEQVLAGTAEILSDLAERGVVLRVR